MFCFVGPLASRYLSSRKKVIHKSSLLTISFRNIELRSQVFDDVKKLPLLVATWMRGVREQPNGSRSCSCLME